MERVEEFTLSGTHRMPPPQGGLAAIRSMPRWVLPSLGIHLLLLVCFSLAAWAFGSRIDELSSNMLAEQEAVVTMGKDTVGLKEETASLREEATNLKTEVSELRQFIASSSSEDVIFLKITILKPEIDSTLARNIARHVHKLCELYGRDPNLVLAMIATESDFNPKARSSVGAIGLMQVLPQWKKVLGIEGDLSEVETSIKVGMQILGFYSEMYRDLEMALTAYNRGPGPVDWALLKGKDPRNKYAPRVLAVYNRLKKLTVRNAAGS